MTEHDGSFRRLIQTVQNQQGESEAARKNRIMVHGNVAQFVHARMRSLAAARSIYVSDLYNVAVQQLTEDLRQLLGDDLVLPRGAVTLSGILGLRDLVDRPIRTPLGDLDQHADHSQHITIYLDDPVWGALMFVSFRFGVQLRQPVPLHRVAELAAAWYLCEFAVG